MWNILFSWAVLLHVCLFRNICRLLDSMRSGFRKIDAICLLVPKLATTLSIKVVGAPACHRFACQQALLMVVASTSKCQSSSDYCQRQSSWNSAWLQGCTAWHDRTWHPQHICHVETVRWHHNQPHSLSKWMFKVNVRGPRLTRHSKAAKFEVIESQLSTEMSHAQSYSRIWGLSALCQKVQSMMGLLQSFRICWAHGTNSQVRQELSLCMKQNILKPACVGSALPTDVPHRLISATYVVCHDMCVDYQPRLC